MDQPIESTFAARIDENPVAPADGKGSERLATLATDTGTAYPALAAALRQPKIAALLRGAFEGSLYLTTLATRDPARLERILMQSPEDHFAELTARLDADMRARPTS